MVTVGSIQRSSPSRMKGILAERIESLGYSQYKVTQEVCKLKAEGDNIPPVTRYNSTVGKALDNPQNVKFYILEELIQALDGEIVILWNDSANQHQTKD